MRNLWNFIWLFVVFLLETKLTDLYPLLPAHCFHLLVQTALAVQCVLHIKRFECILAPCRIVPRKSSSFPCFHPAFDVFRIPKLRECPAPALWSIQSFGLCIDFLHRQCILWELFLVQRNNANIRARRNYIYFFNFKFSYTNFQSYPFISIAKSFPLTPPPFTKPSRKTPLNSSNSPSFESTSRTPTLFCDAYHFRYLRAIVLCLPWVS